MSTPLSVLIVEDSPDDVALMVEQLCRAGFAPEWIRVDTEPDFLAEIKKLPDIVLADHSMPVFSGMRAAALLSKSGLDIPFILISGTVGEEAAVEAMKCGVTDYLLKDRIARLGSSVTRALKEVSERKERRRLETGFIEAQKMEVIGHLAAGVAHDFNNIIAVIMGYSDMLGSELGPDSPLQKYNGEIRHASARAAGLTRQLLVFSRKEKVQVVVLDLNEVVADLDKMLRRLIGENIEMAVVMEKKAGLIKADSGYVGQVLMNLVVNARDAMPNGGKLTITTANATLDESEICDHTGAAAGPPVKAPAQKSDYVMLSVSDTGIGMSDEVKAHLFEAFFTTKPVGKGTGLGLVTCQTIARQCGGHIRVLSRLGQGTAFQIYFPRVKEPREEVSRGLPPGPLPRGTETLLVVEDDASVRYLVVRILEAQGYEVLSAANGQDALRAAREHEGPPVRLVITDVIMPLMGGKAMAEWLKITHPDLKILFTSGYTEEVIAQLGIFESGIAFLAKPYTPVILAHIVREMLDTPMASKKEANPNA